jgi:hypothetical protein
MCAASRTEKRTISDCWLLHAVVHLDYDGSFGSRYLFDDLDFLAPYKVDLARNSHKVYGVPDAVVSLAQTLIELAFKIPCNGGLFLISRFRDQQFWELCR